MSEALLERYGIKAHPARRMANAYIALGMVFFLATAAAAVVELYGIGLSALSLTVLFGAAGVSLRRNGNSAQVVNRALHEAMSGRTADAEALLDYAEPRYGKTANGRAIDFQRALIALRRGDLDVAVERATRVVNRKASPLARLRAEMQSVAALGMRAFAYASLGDGDAARSDIDQVRASALAGQEAIARAELAQAVLLERQGRVDDLRAHLHEQRHVLLNHTEPRERELVRAYQRMLQAKTPSVYRRQGAEETSTNEPGVQDWVARVAPRAAAFVRTTTTSDEDATPIAPQDAPPKATDSTAQRDTPTRAQPRLKVALLVVLVLLVLAILSLVSAGDGGGAPELDVHLASWIVGVALTLLIGGLFALLTWRGNRHTRAIIAASATYARGDFPQATQQLRDATKLKSNMIAAQAWILLSDVAYQAGELEEALRCVDEGLGCLTKQQQTLGGDFIMPGLLCERAVLLVASGRIDEGRAELARIEDKFSSYPLLARAQLRVALLAAARAGDVAAAAQLGSRAMLHAIRSRDELLLDLARAASSPGGAGAGEIGRLRATLRSDPAMRSWVEQIAPTFLEAFENATRIAPPQPQS